MNFDLPKPPKPWENKKSIAFKNWLKAQTNLEAKDWSSDFKMYIEEVSKEGEEKEEQAEPNLEERKEEIFRQYLEELDLTEQGLKDKSIIDVGCGEGEFVISCLEKGITREAYGMDMRLKDDLLKNEYKEKFFSGDFAKDFPIKNMDYVVSAGAISLYLDKKHEVDLEAMLAKAIKAINKNGEVRIWPVEKALRGELDGIKEGEKVLGEVLEKIGKKFDVEWEIKPTDIHVSGKEKDVWLEQVLMIRYKNPEE